MVHFVSDVPYRSKRIATLPTAKPRVQVTLPPPQYELLRRLAKLQRRSMSAVVSELFEQVYPVLERVAVVMQAAVRAQESMKEGLRESTEAAEREVRPLVDKALRQLDLLQDTMEAAAPAAPGASAASPGAPAANPRPSNTGVRSTVRPPSGQVRSPGSGVEMAASAIAAAVRRGPRSGLVEQVTTQVRKRARKGKPQGKRGRR